MSDQRTAKPKLLAHERRRIDEAIEQSKRGMQAGLGTVKVPTHLIQKMLALIEHYTADEPGSGERP